MQPAHGERGGARAPEFTPEDTLAALAHFGGVDRRSPRERLPEALRDAGEVAFEALAYAVRHLAWTGAAAETLCQGRFRKLLVGTEEPPSPAPARRQSNDIIHDDDDDDIHNDNDNIDDNDDDDGLGLGLGLGSTLNPKPNRRRSRRFGEARGPAVVRLDASLVEGAPAHCASTHSRDSFAVCRYISTRDSSLDGYMYVYACMRMPTCVWPRRRGSSSGPPAPRWAFPAWSSPS